MKLVAYPGVIRNPTAEQAVAAEPEGLKFDSPGQSAGPQARSDALGPRFNIIQALKGRDRLLQGELRPFRAWLITTRKPRATLSAPGPVALPRAVESEPFRLYGSRQRIPCKLLCISFLERIGTNKRQKQSPIHLSNTPSGQLATAHGDGARRRRTAWRLLPT